MVTCMPLTFNCLSHGTIAFGFFNIDSDMLLLENYFLFATDFCRYVGDLAENLHQGKFEAKWQVYIIAERASMGDLMGAIHGVRNTGFIGDIYRIFPFPQNAESFKQKPDGYRNQAIVAKVISSYARQIHIPFKVGKSAHEIEIGEYKFSRKDFGEMIQYVWRGGYPRWKNDIRPDYVLTMQATIERYRQGPFENIQFD
jgi:hypothetical protein